MDILASWNQRRVEKRAERRARAHSDEIDRRLRDELMHRRRCPQHDILLIGSCFPSLIFAVVWADCIDSTGAPGSEAEAFTMVKHMKIFHGDDTREEQLAEFRSVIWKILVENSRSIVQAIRNLGLQYLKGSTKVRCFLSLCPLRWHDVCILLHRPSASTS